MPRENPHDKLFKQTFAVRSEAKAFVQLYLPKWISQNLDYRYFKRSSDSFINEQLKEYFSDMVYACRWKGGEKIQISLLLEHKSYIPENILVQLLRYLVEAYDHQLLQKETPSLVIPIVIYHGKQSWKKRTFDTYFNLPDERLKQYLPVFEYEFVDVTKISDTLLKDVSIGYFLRSTFLLFKYKNDKNFLMQESKEIFIFVEKELSEHQKRSFVKSLLTYIFQAYDFEKHEFSNYTKSLPKMVQYISGSIYDQAVKEGEEKGIEKGIEKGMAKGMAKGKKLGEQRNSKITAFNSLLNILPLIPTISWLDIAAITNIKQATLKKIKTALKKTNKRQIRKEIEQLLLKDMKLSIKEKKDINQLWKKYFAK